MIHLPRRTAHRVVLVLVGLAMVATLTVAPQAASATTSTTTETVSSGQALPVWKAVVLGVVEGVTEFLPISSTGHLLVVERWMDVGQDDATRDAIKYYTIIIQIGGILAVLLIFWRRVVELFRGLVGRSADGRRLLIALFIAFLPAAVIGLTLESSIEDRLLEAGPVAAAWIVGGLLIIVFAPRLRGDSSTAKHLHQLSARDGLIIGLAQALALWPGTSRSLVTIVAALVLGYSMAAAVEFSFLLGLATLGAATIYEGGKYGSDVTAAFGILTPLIGIVMAFVAAAVAVKWMVGYLRQHDLSIFGWYRVAIGVITFAALAFGWI